MWKKILLGLAVAAMTTAAGCEAYIPGPAVAVGPAVVVGPPVVFGGYYPHRFGYYGYYGWGHGYYRHGYWRR